VVGLDCGRRPDDDRPRWARKVSVVVVVVLVVMLRVLKGGGVSGLSGRTPSYTNQRSVFIIVTIRTIDPIFNSI
jgi:hypothetical protein